MSKINALCVYCGSSPGTDPAFVEAARDFGQILAENGVRLVYGGGSVGLMGALADAVLEHGGEVTGIIPEFLTKRERPRRLAQELVVTHDMHERKRTMFERADAFVALPGGIGTLEEVVEQTHLGAARPAQEADPDRQHQRLLGSAARLWSSTCGRRNSCRRPCDVNFLVAKHVEEILPKLREAARDVAEADKTMAVPAERM